MGTFRRSGAEPHLVQNSVHILPRDAIITHDRFRNWVVQERIDGWFISWYQQVTRQRRLFALSAHESPPRSSARYIGRVRMKGNFGLKNFTGVAFLLYRSIFRPFFVKCTCLRFRHIRLSRLPPKKFEGIVRYGDAN